MARKKKKQRAVYRKSRPLLHNCSSKKLIVGATGAVIGTAIAIQASNALARI